jgi:hypothetical protein
MFVCINNPTTFTVQTNKMKKSTSTQRLESPLTVIGVLLFVATLVFIAIKLVAMNGLTFSN